MHIAVVLQKAFARARAFPKASRGNIAMIFGLALIPLCLAAGMGLDMSRAMITRVRIGAALDAAGLAIGTQPGMSTDDMQKLANQYFLQNYTADPGTYGTPDPVTVTRPAGSQTITLSTAVKMPTVLMRIAGFDTMDVKANSQITWGQTKIWVALVLDNTGSMCEPDNQPCPHPSTDTKISQLKVALLHPNDGLFDILKNAAANDGDVKVSIVPFSKDVNYAADATGADTVNAPWIDWTDWEAQPPNANVKPASSVGPGSACPYTSKTFGFTCINMQSSKIATTGSYAGMICPGMDSGNVNSGNGSSVENRASHYYNGCYDSSPPTQTSTTTTGVSGTQTCTTVGSGSATCTFKADKRPKTSSDNEVTDGYTADSTVVSVDTSGSPSKASCNGTGSKKSCTTTQDATQNTAVATGTNFTHKWVVNDHSTWNHCFMDRQQSSDSDVSIYTSGDAKFTAENSDACPPSGIVGLNSDWSNLTDQVNAMGANGNTNQTVGLAWGWQTLSQGDPFTPGALPTDTKRYVILLTDGLNTQNRYTTNETTIDARTKALCAKIQADNITVFTVYVNLNPPKKKDAGQTMLEGCASPGMFYALTSADEMPATFKEIATKIANLRVSL